MIKSRFDNYFGRNYWSNNKYEFLKSRLYVKAYKKFFLQHDRSLKFNDLSLVDYGKRSPKCNILQIYSSVNNIGNYLPVLGIQKMLDLDTDTWNIHDNNIDFDYINNNYKAIVVGGAGLLNYCFSPFWAKFSKYNKLPWVLWGVGGCYPDGSVKKGVSFKYIQRSLERCLLINVRDSFTAEQYNMKDASITACPTIVYLAGKEKPQFSQSAKRKKILFSSHEELLCPTETDKIHEKLKYHFGRYYVYTNNVQDKDYGLEDILKLYQQSKLVVATRLHGAIIAYGLGIPYIAIPRDEKVREFVKIYNNGKLLNEIDSIGTFVDSNSFALKPKFQSDIKINPVLKFGEKAKDLLLNII